MVCNHKEVKIQQSSNVSSLQQKHSQFQIILVQGPCTSWAKFYSSMSGQSVGEVLECVYNKISLSKTCISR